LKNALESEDSAVDTVKDVVAVINRYGGIEYTRQRALEYVSKAKKNLEVFKPDVARMSLMAVADYVIERKH